MRRLRRVLLRILLSLVALVLLLALASAVYVAAVPFRTYPPQALWHGPFARIDGRLVAYRHWGTSGSPILLLPGFAESSAVFSAVGPLLGRSHRVYALDLPPYGYSERKGPYDLTAWTDEVAGFAHRFRLVRPTVVGHSLGAAVALSVAQRLPGRGVVLADGDGLSAGGAGFLRHLLIEPFRTALFHLALSWDWPVRRILQGAYGPLHPHLTSADLDVWRRPFHVAGTEAALFDAAGSGIPGYSLAELRQMHVRALALWGSKDDVDSLSAGREAAAALHARLVELPGAGHLAQLVLPRQWAAAVAGFAG